jgi:hypothetical protein
MSQAHIIFRIGGLLLLITFVCAATAAPESGSEPEPAPGTPLPAPAATIEPAAPVSGPREQAIAGRLLQLLPGVEQLWLDSPTGPFLSIHRPAEAPIPHGGMIVNSAPGTIVENSLVLRRIAESAVPRGWSVLSLQQIDSDEPLDAAAARIDAAIAHFAGAGIQNIVIVSDARGAAAALSSMAANASSAIAGFVALGAWTGDPTGLKVSILDIAGTRDPLALNAQHLRKSAASKYAKPVELVQIEGADPNFLGYEDNVASCVRGWLHRATPGIALQH